MLREGNNYLRSGPYPGLNTKAILDQWTIQKSFKSSFLGGSLMPIKKTPGNTVISVRFIDIMESCIYL